MLNDDYSSSPEPSKYNKNRNKQDSGMYSKNMDSRKYIEGDSDSNRSYEAKRKYSNERRSLDKPKKYRDTYEKNNDYTDSDSESCNKQKIYSRRDVGRRFIREDSDSSNDEVDFNNTKRINDKINKKMDRNVTNYEKLIKRSKNYNDSEDERKPKRYQQIAEKSESVNHDSFKKFKDFKGNDKKSRKYKDYEGSSSDAKDTRKYKYSSSDTKDSRKYKDKDYEGSNSDTKDVRKYKGKDYEESSSDTKNARKYEDSNDDKRTNRNYKIPPDDTMINRKHEGSSDRIIKDCKYDVNNNKIGKKIKKYEDKSESDDQPKKSKRYNDSQDRVKKPIYEDESDDRPKKSKRYNDSQDSIKKSRYEDESEDKPSKYKKYVDSEDDDLKNVRKYKDFGSGETRRSKKYDDVSDEDPKRSRFYKESTDASIRSTSYKDFGGKLSKNDKFSDRSGVVKYQDENEYKMKEYLDKYNYEPRKEYQETPHYDTSKNYLSENRKNENIRDYNDDLDFKMKYRHGNEKRYNEFEMKYEENCNYDEKFMDMKCRDDKYKDKKYKDQRSDYIEYQDDKYNDRKYKDPRDDYIEYNDRKYKDDYIERQDDKYKDRKYKDDKYMDRKYKDQKYEDIEYQDQKYETKRYKDKNYMDKDLDDSRYSSEKYSDKSYKYDYDEDNYRNKDSRKRYSKSKRNRDSDEELYDRLLQKKLKGDSTKEHSHDRIKNETNLKKSNSSKGSSARVKQETIKIEATVKNIISSVKSELKSANKPRNTSPVVKAKRSRWGNESDRATIPGIPVAIGKELTEDQQKLYLIQLKIEEIGLKLRTGNLGIKPEDSLRSPSPEPIYNSQGIRQNTRESRIRQRLDEERHRLIREALKINPDYIPPADFKPNSHRFTDKVPIPQSIHPSVNFIGLIIGPRGNTLKKLENETGCKIIIRGQGSLKDGKANGLILPGADEPLHALITAMNEDCLRRGIATINKIINDGLSNPDGDNELRRSQLRELALLNGTLVASEVSKCKNCGSSEHRHWECPHQQNLTNLITCSKCGGVGHLDSDCIFQGERAQTAEEKSKMDIEYQDLMEELGVKRHEINTDSKTNVPSILALPKYMVSQLPWVNTTSGSLGSTFPPSGPLALPPIVPTNLPMPSSTVPLIPNPMLQTGIPAPIIPGMPAPIIPGMPIAMPPPPSSFPPPNNNNNPQ